MILRMAQTLAEFGPGFAFVGQQYPLDVDGDEFCIDQKFLNHICRQPECLKIGRSDQRC
jgi:predicted nuclease of restriction endonuclease-like (RecB) superfamily